MMRSLEAADLRVGIDLVAVAEVREAIEAFGERYIGRLFTEAERAVCGTDPVRRAQRLAQRFAAKEAAIKVLQPEDGVTYTDIEIVSAFDGSPTLALRGPMDELAKRVGLMKFSVSITHTPHYAAATVIAVYRRS